MKYIIGVDGGGTKTEACAFSLDGKIIATGRSGYGNMLVNAQTAINHIVDAISQCLVNLAEEECVYIYIGLAGIDGGAHREELERELEQFQASFHIVNDARIAHAALLHGKDGILTIAGTGSVSYGVRGELVSMAGGWGHLLGDEGSGYWIAVEGLKKMIEEYEEMKPLSPLSEALMKELQLERVADIKKFVYAASKGEIASLVPTIVREAEAGDIVSQDILKEAGKYLGRMTLRLYFMLQFQEGASIAIKGSILNNISFVRDSFMDYINAKVRNVTFICAEESSTKGAYYLALNEIPKYYTS